MTAVTTRTSPVITEPFEVSSGQRVMVVDGDASSRSILEVSLRRAGFEVSASTSGREALQLLQSTLKLPSVVVMSTDLHGEDGYSLCAEIRAEPRTAKLPVLMLARPDDEERNTLADVAQADDLVAKPAFARDVAALVSLWIAPRDASGAYQVDTRELPLPVMLRALLSTQRAGQVLLGRKTFIAYRAGRVTHAEADGLSGHDALVRVLTLGAGPYRVAFTLPTTPPTIEVSLRELVNGIFPRLDKWESLVNRSVPLDARFQVDFQALAKALPTIPDAVNDVVRLFDGQRTVRHVLFDSPLNEVVTLEVANRLQLMGVVAPVKEPTADLQLKMMPKLFEPKATEAEERMSTLFGSPRELLDAIVTPLEMPAVKVPDWYEPPKGTGLEGLSANDGWVEQQLSAFNIQSVIEPSEPKAAEPEVAAFSTGPVPAVEQPTQIEQAAGADPIKLTDVLPQAPAPTTKVVEKALEEQFFAEGLEVGFEDTDPSVPTVSEAVLGRIEDTLKRESEEEEEKAAVETEGSRWLALSIAGALVVALIGVITWRIASSLEEPPFIPPPIAIPEPVVEAAPVVHLETAPPVTVTEKQITAALDDATKQYENGQYGDAIASLEQIIEVEPSSVPTWMLMAMARLDNDEPARAEEAAMTVLALDPNHADAYLLLATMHLRQNKADTAYGEVQRYLELEPKGPHADEAKRLLKRVGRLTGQATAAP